MPNLLGERSLLDDLSLVGADAIRDGLIGRDFGLVTSVAALRRRPGAVGGPALMLRMPALASWTRLADLSRPATGFGFTAAQIRGSASGELVERYAAAVVPDGLPRTGGDAEALTRWLPFTAKQYAEPGFLFAHPATVPSVAWTEAWDLVEQRRTTVPADLAYLRCTSERQWCTMTSNGLAAGRTLGAAVRSAVFELIERDAFFRAWYGAVTAPTLTLDALAASSRGRAVLGTSGLRLAQRVRRGGVRMTLVQLPSALGVPVVLACARSERVGLAVGCAAKPDVGAAVRAAVIEASQTYDWARSLADGDAGDVVVDDLQQHVELHAPPERAALSAFLDSGPPLAVDALLDRPRLSLAEVVAAFGAAGWPLSIADVTAPDVRAAGWYVVRALSPRAATLDTGPIHEAQHDAIVQRVPHPFP